MSRGRIVMLGATGAVGGEVVRELLKDTAMDTLTLLGRRPLKTSDSRVKQHTIDIFDPSGYPPVVGGHQVAICTLGVGQPSKMSRDDFIRIDKQAVIDFATAVRAAGVSEFHLLSSVGTDPESPSFFLRSKGELQEALKALNFNRLCLYQPSMILTPANRYGLSQALTLAVWPVFGHLMFGPLQKFRGIAVAELGAAMARNALQPGVGVEVLQWKHLKALAA